MNCLMPYTALHNSHYITFRCGKCPACREFRANQWKLRLKLESMNQTSVLHLTLTYSDDKLPIYPDNGKRDVQLFLKRLRRLNENMTLRYFCVNELGDKSERLHHHMLLFGFNKGFNHPFKRNDYFASVWQNGHVKVDEFEERHISYICNYLCTPQINGDRYFFILSSRKPGIGCSYLTPAMIDYLSNRYDGLTLFKGKEVILPTYLRKKIFSNDDLTVINNKLREYVKNFDKYSSLIELEDVLYEEISLRLSKKNPFQVSDENDILLRTEYIKIFNDIVTLRNDFTLRHFKKLKKHSSNYVDIKEFINEEYMKSHYLLYHKSYETCIDLTKDIPFGKEKDFGIDFDKMHMYVQSPSKYFYDTHLEYYKEINSIKECQKKIQEICQK